MPPLIFQLARSSLPALAPDLIVKIYEMLDSPSSIVALNLTARSLSPVWKSQAIKISQAVLSRFMVGYKYALDLAEAQGYVLPMEQGDYYKAVLGRNKALISNASKVVLAERSLLIIRNDKREKIRTAWYRLDRDTPRVDEPNN